MNRPIKFRVWLPSLNKFGDDNSVFMDCYGKLYGITRPSLVDDSRSIVNIGQFKEFDGYTIQWYTGLNDKNNNPIYEGDVVARHHVDLVHKVEYLSNDYYKVEYCEKQAAYICRDCDGNYLRLWTFNYEIVGNIYEWPCVKKDKNFDHNGECLTCDAWATDCPFFKLSDIKTTTV